MSKDTRPADTSTTDRPPVEGTTARLILPAEEFAFAPVFDCASNAHVKLEPTVATLDDHALVNVIANERDRDEIESALRMDPATSAVECVAERTDGWTYRLRWDGPARTLM
ncbi:MAG TPA: bacterio-opsin activator domain-containing protein, partial [Halococcus sp.]|nr:bacterio-opsin activator domain-containing protein [Halococcus sp.]